MSRRTTLKFAMAETYIIIETILLLVVNSSSPTVLLGHENHGFQQSGRKNEEIGIQANQNSFC